MRMTFRSKLIAVADRLSVTVNGFEVRAGLFLDQSQKKAALARYSARRVWRLQSLPALRRARTKLRAYWFAIAILGVDTALWRINSTVAKPEGLFSTPESAIAAFAAI